MARLTRRRLSFWLGLVSLFPLSLSILPAAFSQTTLGSIVGHTRVLRGDSPPERILVTLELRGATMDSVYTDSQGTFGFHSLPPNPYYVTISDDSYQSLRQIAVIDPTMQSPTVYLELTLIPKDLGKTKTASPPGPAGANPNLVDVRDYEKRYPKAAVSEFSKGLQADAAGKRDNAIRHYQKAVEIAPDFYPARNNLGSDQLSQGNFAAARSEFEQVVKLNQSDAAGYFNLGNAYTQLGDLANAQSALAEGMRRQPDSSVGFFLLGSLHLRSGKIDAAEKELRQAIALSPTMVQARLQMINLLLQTGKKEEATAQLRDFVTTFPDSSFSPHAKQLLQRLESTNLPN
jgi:tetratricopeptide (TPR) repeat protein